MIQEKKCRSLFQMDVSISQTLKMQFEKKLNLLSLNDLTNSFQLSRLLASQPRNSEVILAADDPFNTEEDFARLEDSADRSLLTLLPAGGHLGFVNEAWTKAKLLTLFNRKDRPMNSPSAIFISAEK